MPRRVNLPGAAELFRPTRPGTPTRPEQSEEAVGSARPESGPGGGSGRVRHDEKITVYVSTDELLALEQARLKLRGEHGMAVDRGRIVREAVSMALEEFARNGGDSTFLRRLTGS